MTAPHERILTRISDGELERRWTAVRAQMRDHSVDAIVMQNASDWVGGYVRWFTDTPANNGYPRTVVFHADEPMTVSLEGAETNVVNVPADETLTQRVYVVVPADSHAAKAEHTEIRIWVRDMQGTDRVYVDAVFNGRAEIDD